MSDFNKGVAVITGGGSGLGKALAHAAAKRGMKVVLADVNAKALEQTLNELRAQGAEAIGEVLDVTDAAAVEALAKRSEAHFGPANLVFNNAGVASAGLIWESTDQDWDWLLAVNVKGVANGIRAFTPQMLAAASADTAFQGCIVNTASLAGVLTGPAMGLYSVSKHAVMALSECLYHDLSLVTRQVKAAVLSPSYVATNIGQCHRVRPQQWANSEGPTRSQMATASMAQNNLDNGSLTAEQVAEITFAAVEDGRFYIFPTDEMHGLLKHRFECMLDNANPDLPYADYPVLHSRRQRLMEALVD
ncbi:SDR family NAD(P)-dependent oxidoreductase [Pseudomonas sp. gcc21]|uniref:SDR family NAD(P)-dependent oxidoreductase n=1 Tax=Pseudomonas sp. gcc21 TaxID=2726989 RepID=UPI001451F3E7|nr:SDR family NAD(P)-dependent oxidoreductase [Pseudomonas sp. gcc21]QJD58999.1 SDR family NAD(P)-dependent oxidoreductase [Pseudomonas sp. gcc21]